jgi:CBS-domain-containing membrane protein
MRVREVMTADVAVAAPQTPVHEIARLMDKRDVTRNTRLDPPLFFQLMDARIPLETPAHYRKRLRHMLGTEARDVMREDPVTIGPDEDAEALVGLFLKSPANPIPVVQDGRLMGIVSRADLLRLMAREIPEDRTAKP